jgi:hypothetical protein
MFNVSKGAPGAALLTITAWEPIRLDYAIKVNKIIVPGLTVSSSN